MAILNFPTNPSTGTVYTVVGATYTWNGYVWLKTNNGAGTYTSVTVTGTGTGALTVGGVAVLTTATTSTFSVHNNTNSTSTTTGAVVISGGIGIGLDVWVGGRVNSESVMIADTVFDSTETPVNTLMSTVIDSYPATQYRTSKYLIQIDDTPTDSFQAVEILMLVANTGSSYSTSIVEYGIASNKGELGVFQHQIILDGGIPTAQLLFQATTATNKVVKVLRTAMTP